MLPRPRFRLPIWAAFAILAAIYVGRSALRGFDFRPDMPVDIVVVVAFLVLVAVVTHVRATFGDATDDDVRDDRP